jgi:hypothetical protein
MEYAAVAQLDRARASEARGRAFESPQPHHIFKKNERHRSEVVSRPISALQFSLAVRRPTWAANAQETTFSSRELIGSWEDTYRLRYHAQSTPPWSTSHFLKRASRKLAANRIYTDLCMDTSLFTQSILRPARQFSTQVNWN